MESPPKDLDKIYFIKWSDEFATPFGTVKEGLIKEFGTLVDNVNYIVREEFTLSKKITENFRTDTHNVVINNQDEAYWWPKWFELTSSTGIIQSIASNYSKGYKMKPELVDKLRSVVRREIELRIEHDNVEISVRSLMKRISEKIREDKNDLTPSRFQIISSPCWNFRMIISDNPRIDFKEINFPTDNSDEFFPTEWLVKRFQDVKLPNTLIAGSDQDTRILDIFLDNSYSTIYDIIIGHDALLGTMLREIGFLDSETNNFFPKQKAALLLRVLGYEPERIAYNKYFEIKFRDESSELNVFKNIETRCSEVYDAWVKCFSKLNSCESTQDFFNLLNKDNPVEFNHDGKFTMGKLLTFNNFHKSKASKDANYRLHLDKCVAKKFQFLDKDTFEMLEILAYQRNNFAHSEEGDYNNKLDHLINNARRFNWPVPNKVWNISEIVRCGSEFFDSFYGVSKDQDIPKVPTLMKVISIEDNVLGTRAILQCQRNGVKNKLVLDKNKKLLCFGKGGKVLTSNILKPLRTSQKFYVMPTSNPVLISPVIVH